MQEDNLDPDLFDDEFAEEWPDELSDIDDLEDLEELEDEFEESE